MTRTGFNSSCYIEFLLSPSSSFVMYHRHYFVFIQDISRHTGTVYCIQHDNNSNSHHYDDRSSRSIRRSSFSVDSKHNIIDNDHDDFDNNDSDNSKKKIIDDN